MRLNAVFSLAYVGNEEEDGEKIKDKKRKNRLNGLKVKKGQDNIGGVVMFLRLLIDDHPPPLTFTADGAS